MSRCFPGKRPTGGDRVPAPEEIADGSARWERGFALLSPALVRSVGKLAIGQFLGERPLVETIGQKFRITYRGHAADCMPLPHPSGGVTVASQEAREDVVGAGAGVGGEAVGRVGRPG